MKATKIQNSNSKTKTTARVLQWVCNEIVLRAGLLGFITEAEVLSDTSINIGLHMRSFRVDTMKIGHNAKISNYCKSPKGYKRTDVPTWDQRVEFNGIVNRVFNDAKLDAKIISGNYTVRTVEDGAETAWPSGGDRANTGWSATASDEIMTESEAREYCDSDSLIQKHRETMKPLLRERARAYRAHVRELNRASFVAFKSHVWPKNGRGQCKTVLNIMTMAEFKAYNAEQSRWKRVPMTDCRPVPSEIKTKAAAKNYLAVIDRLNERKG